MNAVKQYVSDLTDSEKRQIIAGWVEFEREGSIGDEPIRTHAENFMSTLPGSSPLIVTFWMQQLAFEVYRYYADLMLDQLDDPLSAINQMRDY